MTPAGRRIVDEEGFYGIESVKETSVISDTLQHSIAPSAVIGEHV
jgi:hypothetical protein